MESAYQGPNVGSLLGNNNSWVASRQLLQLGGFHYLFQMTGCLSVGFDFYVLDSEVVDVYKTTNQKAQDQGCAETLVISVK